MNGLGANVLSRGQGSRRRRRMGPRWAVLVVLVASACVGVWLAFRRPPVRRLNPPAASVVHTNLPPPVIVPWKDLRYPSRQILLSSSNLAVFQPTASGNPESALFGSTRTAERGGHVMSSFHEGVDIAALQRDRGGRPLDTVHAIAGARVAYVNRVAGNSNYGKYVVLAHADPMGEVYSLYAHLAEVAPAVRAGEIVEAGAELGRMGNTSSTGIPMERGHLHLEMALLSNSRFDEWYHAQKLVPDHGDFNGQNLLGVDPLAFLKSRQKNPELSFAAFIATVPRAFDVILRTGSLPDYFRRYAALWVGPPADGAPIALSCAQNGLPLSGRRATEDECRALGRRPNLVQNVDEAVLGRNGSHLIRSSAGSWGVTASGLRWLEILTYPDGVRAGAGAAPAAGGNGAASATGKTARGRTRR